MSKSNGGKRKGKVTGILDAVSALTSLGDEDEKSDGSPEPEEKPEAPTTPSGEPGASPQKETEGAPKHPSGGKRFIPDHKKPDAALTFPEKLMNMMRYADDFKNDEKYCIAWLPDGKSFVIRNPENFTRQVLPKFFKATKFQSFTRKLYRWGFRQVNRGIGPDDPIIFGNECFQRDNEELMVKMRSVTAAASRKKRGDDDSLLGRKRSLEELDEQRKMILLDRLMQEKAAMAGGDFAMMGGFRGGPAGMARGFTPPGMMPNHWGRFPTPNMMGPPQGQFNMFMQQPPPQQQQQSPQPPQAQQQGQKGDQPQTPQKQQGQESSPQQQSQGGGGGDGGTPQQGREQEIMSAAMNVLRYAA